MNAALQRNLLLGAVAALAVAAFAAWWMHAFERKPVEIPLPPRGEAAYNPLYALKRALQADGVAVQSRRRLAPGTQALAPGDTVLLLGDLRALPRRDADALLAWVERGGHLIAELPAARDAQRQDDAGPLLQALDVTVKPVPWACAHYRDAARGTEPAARLCGNARIALQSGRAVAAHWHDHDYDADVHARLAHGSGSVDLLVSLDFLQGTALQASNAAALTRQLLAPRYGRGTVHLVYDADMPPLWKLLLERAWMAWLPLLLATLGWLWWRTQRRGPLLPGPQPARRSLIEHVQASGEHVHRYGRGHLLHASLRALFDARLRRRDPYAASLDGQAQRQAIAARTGLTEAEVEAALRAPVPFVAADLRLRIAKLNRLKARL
jgi:hypothetical protein